MLSRPLCAASSIEFASTLSFGAALSLLTAGCSSPSPEPTAPPPRPAATATADPSSAATSRAPESTAAKATPASNEPTSNEPPQDELSLAPPSNVPETASGGSAATAEPLEKTLSQATSSADLIRLIDEAASQRGGGRAMLEQIVGATESDVPEVRWRAARAIGLFGKDAIAEIPTLIRLLGDEDPVVVAQAAAAIGMIREDDSRQAADLDDAGRTQYDAATKALVARIVHPDARVRRVCVRSLSLIKPPAEMLVPLVAKQLADKDPSVVVPALHTMADAGAAAVPFLTEALKNPQSRYWASVVLAEIGPDAAAAVPELLAVAEEANGEPEERMQAILALAAIGKPAETAGDALAGMISTQTGPVQFAAAYASGMLRSPAASEALEPLAASQTPFLSGLATWALARIHPDDAARTTQAFDKLMVGLEHEEHEVRSGSVSGLSDLDDALTAQQRGTLATALTKAIQDANPGVREAAAAALVRLGSEAVPALTAMLGQDPERQQLGTELLAAIGPAASGAFEQVLGIFEAANDDSTRADAAFAMGAIGGAADADGGGSTRGDVSADLLRRAVGALSSAVNASAETAPEVRYTAIYALGRFGSAAAPAAATLQELASSDDVLLATVAAWAGLKIEPENRKLYEQAIPLLEKALRSERELARLEAAVALGEIGPDASGSVPLLELVREDDPSRTVRAAAAHAIDMISGASPAGS